MKVIRNEVTTPFDVDATLILWIPEGMIAANQDDIIVLDYYGEPKQFLPHKEQVSLLRAALKRKKNVIVWSGNGYAWAEQVLKALGFTKKDKITVMTKPVSYVDDKPCESWMGSQIYIPPPEDLWFKD